MLPRIYSLSTVGVIQHYNEDYLIHQTRTDFTGGNGVGKSIIADLLQLIFIHDKKLIKFGTKGFKKNDRQPYTLPYKTDEAYAFLNIEIIENFFICIGVCIPNKDNKRIKPFVIVSDEDINKKIEDLVYPEEKLLKSQHFIEGNAFLSIEQLSRHLRDNHGLTLISFTNREHKEKYYSFLFKRGILPINLSIEENLKTYAKIIQSFSKVDALNVDSSDSLKGFLFEDSKEDYRKEFDAYKRDLENLLTDYERTNKNINNLLQKQKKLNALKDKEIKKSTTHQAYLKADVLYHYSIKENKKTAFSKVERSIEDNRLQKVEYTNYKNEFNSKYENSVQKIRTLKNSLENIQKYKLVYDKLKEMEEKKCSLTQVEVPKISEKIEKTINIDDFDHKEIIRRIKKFKLIYNDYDSLKELENKTLEQLEKLDDHKNELKSKIKRFKEILQIIDLNKKGTLFSKLLNRGLPLTEATETILFHFINMAWGKPNEVTSGIKYTEDINVLEKEHIIKDNESGGYWLKMGGIYEFIPFNKEQQRLFNDQDNIRQAIMEQQKNIQESIGIYEEQLSEIESFKRGDNSLASNVTIQNYDLDGRMYSYAIIKELYETADIIQNLDIKIDYYNTEIASCEKQLVEFKKNIVGEFENEKLDVLEKSLNAKLAVQEQNRDEYLRSGARENTKIEKLIEEMPHRNNEKKEKEAELNQAKLYYIEKLTSFERDCPNIKVCSYPQN